MKTRSNFVQYCYSSTLSQVSKNIHILDQSLNFFHAFEVSFFYLIWTVDQQENTSGYMRPAETQAS